MKLYYSTADTNVADTVTVTQRECSFLTFNLGIFIWHLEGTAIFFLTFLYISQLFKGPQRAQVEFNYKLIMKLLRMKVIL